MSAILRLLPSLSQNPPENEIGEPGELARIVALDLPFKHVGAICACSKAMLIVRVVLHLDNMIESQVQDMLLVLEMGQVNIPTGPPGWWWSFWSPATGGLTTGLCGRRGNPQHQVPLPISRLLFHEIEG